MLTIIIEYAVSGLNFLSIKIRSCDPMSQSPLRCWTEHIRECDCSSQPSLLMLLPDSACSALQGLLRRFGGGLEERVPGAGRTKMRFQARAAALPSMPTGHPGLLNMSMFQYAGKCDPQRGSSIDVLDECMKTCC